MFDSLTEKFTGLFKDLSGQGKLSEANIKEASAKVRRALLEADVNYKVVKDFAAAVEARALGGGCADQHHPRPEVRKSSLRPDGGNPGLGQSVVNAFPPAAHRDHGLRALRARARPPPAPSWPSTCPNRAGGSCWRRPTSTGRRRCSSWRFWPNRWAAISSNLIPPALKLRRINPPTWLISAGKPNRKRSRSW
ncbi:signal recognition particle receptor subunit alpha [candidate division TA06 bacterium]|uniref:Signal recognition particle receptor subunit alpha n=1 Tax=candidate division TA06 bacterium TaxID=2250710 RepID=A0A933IEB7_UNCT6|nr:signal recognition particle receptor subunit alpha [candidate division TA06 bacterium]